MSQPPARPPRPRGIDARYAERAALGVDAGIIRRRLEDDGLDDGATITLDGREVANFGVCSYLGLNQDQRLREAAIEAVRRYGVSYSSSTVYTSIPLYAGLEERLSQITGGETIVTPTTTLGHLTALPVLITRRQAVVVDAQAHHSVRLATQVLRAEGIEVEIVPHNDLEALTEALERRCSDHPQVWYLADGVYSMYGDVAPLATLAGLLDRFDNLWMYLDDAHGFSWAGRSGRGVVLEELGFHPRLVLAISLSKSFGAGGGAVVLPDPELAERVRLVGGPLTFGGPLQVAELAAGVASGDIHLSSEHAQRQSELVGQFETVRRAADELGLPLTDRSDTPIWFVEVGRVEDMIEMIRALLADGYYTNAASFPAVPIGGAGVRFTHTVAHDEGQIVGLLERLAHHRRRVLGDDTELVVDLREQVRVEDQGAAR